MRCLKNKTNNVLITSIIVLKRIRNIVPHVPVDQSSLWSYRLIFRTIPSPFFIRAYKYRTHECFSLFRDCQRCDIPSSRFLCIRIVFIKQIPRFARDTVVIFVAGVLVLGRSQLFEGILFDKYF